MKKLGKLKLEDVSVIKKEEMKQVVGGNASSTCTRYSPSGEFCFINGQPGGCHNGICEIGAYF